MYELNFVGVSIAWDPCDEGENPKCSICASGRCRRHRGRPGR